MSIRKLFCSLFVSIAPCAFAGDAAAPAPLFTATSAHPGVVVLDWQESAVRAAAERREKFLVRDVPLGEALRVDFELEPFSVTGPTTRFVVGRSGQPDLVLPFDPSRIALFHGSIPDRPGSHVVLTFANGRATGSVDLGAGSGTYRIAPSDPLRSTVFPATAPGELPPDVPLCGNDDDLSLGSIDSPQPATEQPFAASTRGLKHLELAVETDFEFFSLFGNPDDAATYLVEMYGQVSAIFMRDVDTRIELVFARIWTDPNDLFNDVDPSPLPEFRSYWNDNMDAVDRDVAQLFSGRRDYPFGGQAYLSSLCGSSAYSVVGYALGFFPDPSHPSPYHYDIAVTAHELGHNAGTGHTHSSPNNLDTCNNTSGDPQRGTIMSYCGQTWSGGNANRELYFHTTIQANMDSHIGGSSCVPDDCNQNNVPDGFDIGNGSTDADGNGIPDECEDCNTNGVLDDTDISSGTSLDLNGNSIPDDCEPDCNGNAIPDDKDIADSTSLDAHGDGIPDECDLDCDLDTTSDYSEIQNDMTLDVDRDALLDACQDCDTDGTPDLDALDGAHEAWVASGIDGSVVRRFTADVGVLTHASSGGGAASVAEGRDLIVAPDGRVLVSSGTDDRVMEFDRSGTYLGDLVPPGLGGLDAPAGLVLTSTGTLLVASAGTDSVLAYDGTTGSFLGEFVPPGSGGLDAPFGLAFGPLGDLLVTSATDEVLEYYGPTGAFLGAFVAGGANGGLSQPRGLSFKPDGNLLVASFGTDEVLEYDGLTGQPLGKWAQVGTATNLTQESPWGVRVGPNGNVFVSRTGEDNGSSPSDVDDHHDHDDHFELAGIVNLHLTNARIYEFDARNGNFLRTYIGGNDHGLEFPTGFAFTPGWIDDCNFTLLPDSCDIASGSSADVGGDGIPDECQIDCNGNGRLDRLDVIPFGPEVDCNFNRTPDDCDTASGTSLDCDANGVPDECEPVGMFLPGGGCPTCLDPAQCDDALACTTDSCDAGACGHTLVAGSCLIGGTCYAVDDPNPINDCKRCDPVNPGSWTSAPPFAVDGVRVDRTFGAQLSWNGQGTGTRYDVVGGDLSTLRNAGSVTDAICLENDVIGTVWDDLRPDPSAGDGYYYLVRSTKSCGTGTYGQSSLGAERVVSVDCP